MRCLSERIDRIASQIDFDSVMQFLAISLFIYCLTPTIGYCTVETTLAAIQSKLITTILPLVGILGIVWAGLSFAMGSPNARTHLFLAIIGLIVGFGAPSIMSFIKGLVQ